MKSFAVYVSLALVVLALGTWLALEWSGVAIITTHPIEGEARETHVWFAQTDDGLWLEAGAPENPWFLDVQSNPSVSIEAEGISGAYRVEVVSGHEAARRVRSLFREKYGTRDLWVGLFVESAASTAVRLHPVNQTRSAVP
jgi:hypothetical protein